MRAVSYKDPHLARGWFYIKEVEWYWSYRYYVTTDYFKLSRYNNQRFIDNTRNTLLGKYGKYFWTVTREFARTVVRVTSYRSNKEGHTIEVYHYPSDLDIQQLDVLAENMVSLLESELAK